jgi:hypothetical protein
MKQAIAISLFLLVVSGVQLFARQAGSSNLAEPQATGERKPDLVPILRTPINGEIRVKNVGTGSAHPSKLTLDCVRLGVPSQMYSCPNLPVSVAPLYFDEDFPNNATIKVPALAPGETFVHKLSFWDVSDWPKGKYKFTVTVDAAHVLNETNTKNNVTSSTLVVP